MTLILLYQENIVDRICSNGERTLKQFWRTVRELKSFADKAQLGKLLSCHYQFLQHNEPWLAQAGISAPTSQRRANPVMQCLRSDIQKLCDYCPVAASCHKSACDPVEALGLCLALIKISDIYAVEQRRLAKYMGCGVTQYTHFIKYLLRHGQKHKSQVYHVINRFPFKGKQEAALAASYKQVIDQYRTLLVAEATQGAYAA